jgi:Flp pilus assembly protein TadD
MGTLMYGVGNFDLARSFLVHAVRADPSDAVAQQALGCALVRLRREGEASRFFERAGGSAAGCR